MNSVRGFSKRWSIAIYAVSIVLFMCWGRLSTSWETSRQDTHDLDVITKLSPVVAVVMALACAATAVVLAFLAYLGFARSVIRYPAVALLLAIVAFPFAGLCHLVNNLGPWTLHGQVVDADGHTYVFCDSSFLQDQTMAIARVEHDGVFAKQLRVLVANHGDSPRSWASIIRPQDPMEGYGQLYLTADDILVGVRSGNQCCLAYDLSSQRRIGHDDIEGLSPFICLDRNSPPHEADVAATIKNMREYIDFVMTSDDIRFAGGFLSGDSVHGYPSVATLQNGLSHKNPQVQDAARRILLVHARGVNLIQARVSGTVNTLCGQLTSEDIEKRRNAVQLLGSIGGPGADAAVPELAKLVVVDNDAETRRYASQSLGLIGPAAIATLIELARNKDSTVRSDAIFGMQAAGSAAKTPEAEAALKAALNDGDGEIRSRAKRVLEDFESIP